MARSDHHDYIDWDARREGYVDHRSRFIPVIDIPKTRKQKAASRALLSIRAEERLGSLLAS